MRFVGGSSKKNKTSSRGGENPANAKKGSSPAGAGAGAGAAMTDSLDDSDNSSSNSTPIYYFGYGAMVNPIARQRRGVNTDEAHAALLRNYRLTFSYGGAANIVEARGYEVFGIVMKCSTQADWNLLKDFDAGYDCVEVDVYSLKQKDTENSPGDDDDDNSLASEEEGFAQVHETPIKARVFVLPKDQITAATSGEDPPKIPQERYLRVIASGMRAYGVDPDYINDEIMGVEFIPSRKPENYLTFPPPSTATSPEDIPTLPSLEAWEKEYQKLIQKEQHKAKKNKAAAAASSGLIIFRLGEHIMRVTDPDMSNPFNVWAKDRLHGPQDSTWVIVQTLFDPDLPLIAKPEEVTSAHQRWAENQMMEKFQQAGVEATTVYRVQLLDDPSGPSQTQQPQPQQRIGRRGSIRSFVRNSIYSFKSRGTSTTASQRSSSLGGGSNHQHQHRHQQNPPLSPTSNPPSITSSATSSKRNRLFRRLPKSRVALTLRTKLLPTLRSNNSSSHSQSASHKSGGNGAGAGGGGGSASDRSRRSSIKTKKDNSIKADPQHPVIHNNSTSHDDDDDNSVTESCCIDRCEQDEPDDDLISPSVLAIHDGGGCCMMIGDSSGEFHRRPCHLEQDHRHGDDDGLDATATDRDDHPVVTMMILHHNDVSNNNDTISCSNTHDEDDDDDDDQLFGSGDGGGPPPISTLSFATSLTEDAKTPAAAAAAPANAMAAAI